MASHIVPVKDGEGERVTLAAHLSAAKAVLSGQCQVRESARLFRLIYDQNTHLTPYKLTTTLTCPGVKHNLRLGDPGSFVYPQRAVNYRKKNL